MPYTVIERRLPIYPIVEKIIDELFLPEKELSKLLRYSRELTDHIEVGGDLNYTISLLIWSIFDSNPSYSLGESLINTLCDVKDNNPRNILGDLIWTLIFSQLDDSTIFKSKRVVKGTLECIIKEFYDRRLRQYEDEAIKRNGDVETIKLKLKVTKEMI